jgi:hypothetical protein
MIRDYDAELYDTYFSPAAVAENKLPLFSSIDQAKSLLEYGCCLFTSSITLQPTDSSLDAAITDHERVNISLTLLSKFSITLNEFVELKRASFTPRDDIAASVLQLHILNFQVMLQLEIMPPNYRSSREMFTPHFREMVALGEKIVAFISADYELGRQRTSFCQDIGFIIPLYTVAIHCRDPEIRRKSISTLRSTSRQESIWNSQIIAKATERIMEIEEDGALVSGLGSDTLDQFGNPSVFTILQLDGRGARLEYVRQGYNPYTHMKMVEEMCTWENMETTL